MNESKLYRVLVVANLTTLILIPLILLMLWMIRSILSPVLSALLVAYLMYPVVKWGSRIGIPRIFTVLALVLALIASTAMIGISFLPAIQQQIRALTPPDEAPAQISVVAPEPAEEPQAPSLEGNDEAISWPEAEFEPEAPVLADAEDEKLAESRVRQLVNRFFNKLEDKGWSVADKTEMVQKVSDYLAVGSLRLIRRVTGLAVEWGQFLMIFFFVLIFALLDGHKIQRAIVQLIPNEFYESTLFILYKSQKILGDYLRGLFVENLLLGLLTLILILPVCLSTELSLMMGLVVALIFATTNVIRIIGPIIGGVVGAFLVFAATNDLRVVLAVVIVALIIQLLDSVVVMPLIMKDQVNIHPVICLLGVIVGGILGGILGMILAIPVISGIKVLYRVLSVEMKRFVEHGYYGDYTLE